MTAPNAIVAARSELAVVNFALEGSLAEHTAALAEAKARLHQEIAARGQAEVERNSLLLRLAAAQETERRHLSRELHDEVGQHLTALALGLQALTDVTEPGSEAEKRVAVLRGLTDTLGRELHALAVQLRPRALDDFGLEAAIASYAESWSRRHGRRIDVHTQVATRRLSAAVESAIYRIVQEALTNVARHSSATRASVVVERHGAHICVAIDDDGGGFDPGKGESSGGLGLLGIRERARLLDGTVDIESSPGAGTTLFVRIPLKRDETLHDTADRSEARQ